MNYALDGFIVSGESDTAVKVDVTWGIKELDKEDVSIWDASNPGKVKFDPYFNMAP